MSVELQIQLMLNITFAAVLSGIIGINRERTRKSAGLRTHILTGTGACLFTLLSLHGFSPAADSSRVAANIVSGIGFLGGGIIIQRKSEAYDVTTAAGIWATAAVGMAMGVGAWLIAIYSTLVLWVVLEIMKRMKSYAAVNDSSKNKEEKASAASDLKNQSYPAHIADDASQVSGQV